eukprot:TRINITY_DN110614_c0_g1_i1.p1 TRINITY_DN110614_c0_g1~~TRINITY_DN110614_c0_g1_i1.p1  ORF type:complete len:391 (+),score=67.47 TRINITY_DN110614_c0_g1_i1:1-1173(+)
MMPNVPWWASTALGQVAILACLRFLPPEVEEWLLQGSTDLLALISLMCLGFMSLFCVAILSNDLAYIFVRLTASQNQVWLEATRTHWALAWLLVWLAQVPLWHALPPWSLLLVHEVTNFTVSVHHWLLRRLGSGTIYLPSAGIIAYTDGTQRSHSFVKALTVRCGLPLAYVLCNGMPADWKQVGFFLGADVLPALLLGLWHYARKVGMCGLRLRGKRWSWALAYPPAHGGSLADTGAAEPEEDDCPVHGTCPICLSNLCCPGGGAAAARWSVAVQRRTASGLSACRLRSTSAAAGLSLARTRACWMGGRIATTKCGHSFHAECLMKAAKALPRCPQCRAGLGSADHKLQLPDEEILEAQMLSLLFGICSGALLLLVRQMLLWRKWLLVTA